MFTEKKLFLQQNISLFAKETQFSKSMKRCLFIVSFIAATLFLSAQSDYSNYLNKALEKLEAGDCEAAQKNYNVYKELSHNEVKSVEVLIEDCLDEGNFHIGDQIDVNGEKYIVAYLTENKQHGFAIKDEGMDNFCNTKTLGYRSNNKIPSIDELEIIYKNNDKIGLTAVYWTRSLYRGTSSYDYYYTIDFLTGGRGVSDERNKNGILLIHRF